MTSMAYADVRAIGWSGDFANHRFRRCVVLLARSRPWQAWMERHFRGKRARATGAVYRLLAGRRSARRQFERRKSGCRGFGLRKSLSTQASRAEAHLTKI